MKNALMYRVSHKKLALALKCHFGPKEAPAAPNGLKKAKNGLKMAGYIKWDVLGLSNPPESVH